MAQVNPWVRGAFTIASGGLFIYNNWNKISDFYGRAKNWRWPRDPIILDLDGDGLETVGLASNVYFDHDGDGVLTKTGWVGRDDALLVWDRNANGAIDTGAELFGDFTVLPNGTLAPNGFAALAALDANGDGVIDASDPAFAELKLWKDADQNGQTGEGELISLQDTGIVSLNLANTLKNQPLANGNQLTREGSFSRADGTTGGMGEFQLAIDTFDTRFAEAIEVSEALKSLPNMQGAGNVRELHQAATQSSSLAALLAQFQAAPTRSEQKALLDPLITSWADTSGMAGSLEERAAGKYRIQYDAFGMDQRSNHIDTVAFAAISSGSVGDGTGLMSDAGGLYLSERYRNLIAEWSRKLHVLEAFNGQYFFNLPEEKSQTEGANWGLSVSAGSGGGGSSGGTAMAIEAYPTLRVNFSQGQLDLLQQAYDSLKESVYGSLVMQTRLKPYLDQIELVIDEQGLRLDATQLNQMLADKRAADPENYLADLLDLDRYANGFLSGTNWSGLADFDTLIDTLPQTAGVTALLEEFKVKRLTADDDTTGFTDKADIVLAGDGKDTLYGYAGSDRLFGQGGDDRIYGGAGDDLISGGAGNDVLAGESGADTYIFGRGYGNDTISDYAENSIQRDTVRLLGLNPADIQVTADYADNLVFTIVDTGETLSVPRGGYWWGQNGVGQYVFDDGTVWSHDDALRATVAATTENDDVIHGSSAGDAITGQAGNDTLIGSSGDDVIDGGAGNDTLIGATGWNWIYENGSYRVERNTTPTISANGNDTYLFGRGDGQDTVIDGDYTAGNSDTLRFKEGVAPADVKLIRSGNDLVLAIRGSSDQVTLKQYFDEAWNGANGPYLIERIAFHDGTVLNFADVQATLFAGSEDAETIIGSRAADVLTGRGGNDTLIGNGGDDRLEGGDGDDLLLGGAGRDILDGGASNDVLRGGAQRDAYVVNLGDGEDMIEDDLDAGIGNALTFGEGIARDDVRLEVDGDDLLIHYGAIGDVVRVSNYAPDGASGGTVIDTFEFADGTAVTLREFMNRAPEVANPIDDQVVLEDAAFTLVLPDDLFIDADGDNVLTRVTVSGYTTLPDWLQYDAATRTLFGTPDNADVGEFDVIVQGMDTLGASSLHSFHVTVQNTNDAPEIGTPLSDLRALEDNAFSFTLPADSFRDVDAGDALTYTATLANGDPLPSWLTFDAQTGTFSGTPANGDVGELRLAVTATDLAGASASQTFALEVTNTNDAPTVGTALAAQTATEDTAFTFAVPTEAFVDADLGDRLSYSATLADGSTLPEWLQFDVVTGTFSGTPGNDHVGALEIRVTASDLVGASASQSFSLTVANTNDAPEVAVALGDQQATEDAPFAFTVPQDAFRDVDAGDVLTLSATQADGSALPTWLRFDAATRTFSGTPVNGDVGSVSVRLIASDVVGASASQTFAIGVANVNDAPEVGTVLANQTGRAGTALSWQLPGTAFVDVDTGDVLTYSATLSDGAALPDWLAFDAATGTFSGTPASAGNYALRVTATDLAGASASQTFALEVTSGPITAPDAANVIEDRKLFTWGNVLANDRDPEGERLSVADAGIRRGEYGVLTLLSNGTYAYVLDDCSSKVQGLGAGETVTETFNYLASDGTQRSTGALTVTVQGANDTPDLVRCLSDVQLAKGKAFSWQVPAGSFKDADRNDRLTYTATLSNGKPLPSWLKFDAATQTFSGTAPANAKGSIDVRVTASDGHGECSTASDDFKVSFGSKTVVPTAHKGNEGVGNGADAPPPGHGANINDGAGTAPGQPGRKHGGDRDDDPLGRFLDGFKRDDKSAQPALPALDRRWFEQWGEPSQASGQAGQGQANHDVERHWAELTHALNRLDAERQSAPAWNHANQGADLSGLAGWMQGGGHGARGGVDAVSLACGTGTQLKGFSGIKEGVGKLSW